MVTLKIQILIKKKKKKKKKIASNEYAKYGNLIKDIWYNRFSYMTEKESNRPETIELMVKYEIAKKSKDRYNKKFNPRTQSLLKEALGTFEKGKKSIEGKGLKKTSNTIVIPEDIETLGERLRLLWASKKVGHSNVRNEIIAICDELKRQNGITPSQYNVIMNEI